MCDRHYWYQCAMNVYREEEREVGQWIQDTDYAGAAYRVSYIF